MEAQSKCGRITDADTTYEYSRMPRAHLQYTNVGGWFLRPSSFNNSIYDTTVWVVRFCSCNGGESLNVERIRPAVDRGIFSAVRFCSCASHTHTQIQQQWWGGSCSRSPSVRKIYHIAHIQHPEQRRQCFR
eukprot:scaffold7213_cov166-Amphora_coffeaeformis.AAC.14